MSTFLKGLSDQSDIAMIRVIQQTTFKNNIQSELSAVGAKRDVENTPKPTRQTVSLPQDGFGLVRLKYCSPSEQNPKCMFVEQSYFQGQLCYALNIDVKIFQLCIPIWLCGFDRTIEHVVNLL